MESRVALSTRSRYFGLLNPLTNGGSGPMSIVPMAHVSPACLSSGKNLGAISSMLTQPSCLATLIAWGMSQYFSKHQYTIDCLIRPFLTARSAERCSCAGALIPSAATAARPRPPSA